MMNTVIYIPLADVEVLAKRMMSEYFITKAGSRNRAVEIYSAVDQMPNFGNFLEMICDELNWQSHLTFERAITELKKFGIDATAAEEISSEVFKLVTSVVGSALPGLIVGDSCISRAALFCDGGYDLMIVIPNSDQVHL